MTVRALASEELWQVWTVTRRDIALMHFFLFRPTVALNPALPSWKMSVFVTLLAMFGTSRRLAFVPQVNTVLLLGAPMLPTRWLKILTYLQLERFLFFIFYNLTLLILFLLSSLPIDTFYFVIIIIFITITSALMSQIASFCNLYVFLLLMLNW
jgi:hypothetical protein